MQVTVILCTYNRCQSLAIALESVAASRVPSSIDWHVLVVDNNSKDDTRKVAESFGQRDSAHFRYVFESKQGKSNALNRGIAEAAGEILAFIDDDVTVEPDWLAELVQPLVEPQWAGTGGRVYLPKSFVPPDWMAIEGDHSLVSILAQFDLGSKPHELKMPPLGNNMAFRKSVFEKVGGFRTDLGPMPGSQIRYEDTEFGQRVMQAGGRVLYAPGAIVRHAVEDYRLHKAYFLAYHFDYGRALVREKGPRKPVGGIIPRFVISVPNRLLHFLPKGLWEWVRESDPQKRFFNKCRVWTTFGEIGEILRSALARAEDPAKRDKAPLRTGSEIGLGPSHVD